MRQIVDAKDEIGRASCLLCGGAADGPAFPYGTCWEGKRFSFFRCASCRTGFIDPVPSAADFAKMYARSSYHALFYEEITEDDFSRSLSQLQAGGIAAGHVLDFGCGNGAFLRAARRAGFTADGVELDAETIAAAAANSGCEVFTLEELEESARKYDVVHLGDVLEHLPDPAAMMRRLRQRLSSEGVFLIEGPLEDNASLVFYTAALTGRAKRLLGRGTEGSFIPFHLWRTDARSQRRFFERTLGYEILSFTVQETGWPYVNATASVFQGSPANLVRHAIGKASILVAGLAKAAGLSVGNRFIAVLKPGSG